MIHLILEYATWKIAMHEIKRKTQPMFMPSPLATATSHKMLEEAHELKKSENSPVARAVCSLLHGVAFITEQADALRTEVKWNTENSLNLDFEVREVKAEQDQVRKELNAAQKENDIMGGKRSIISLIASKGYEICCAILLLLVGAGLPALIDMFRAKGTP